jgi:hypothetical protein
LQEQSADHCPELIRNFQGFQTAQGINHSLKRLYELLAQNRISPRRAAVLSYISSLLLRTLPQIDADRAAGIADPTKKPLPIDVPVQVQYAAPEVQEEVDEDEVEHEVGDADEVKDSDLDSDPDSAEDLEADTDTETQPEMEMAAHPGSTNTWEPDPKKKPS